jgi:hypothetical protein
MKLKELKNTTSKIIDSLSPCLSFSDTHERTLKFAHIPGMCRQHTRSHIFSTTLEKHTQQVISSSTTLANLPARAELQSWQKLHPVGWHRHIESEETGNKQVKDTFYSAPRIQDNISTFKISQNQ